MDMNLGWEEHYNLVELGTDQENRLRTVCFYSKKNWEVELLMKIGCKGFRERIIRTEINS